MRRNGTAYDVTWLNVRFIFRGIVTHHAEDGSGIGSAIIAGELPALLRAGFNLTCDPSDDEEEEGERTVSELLRKPIQTPIEFAGRPFPQCLCVEIPVSDICVND